MDEGERRLDRRIREEGLQRCPGQPYTPRDGNCGPRAILHVLATVKAHKCEEYEEGEPDIFRKLVCHYFLRQVKEGVLHYSEGNILDWHDKMKKSGTHVDYYWMTSCARMLDRDIILIPTSTASATEIGRMIRISCGFEDIIYPPIFLGYLEDNIFTSGHFQALIPEMGKECPIVDYLHDGEIPYPHRRKKLSSSVSSFSLPLSTRQRIFSSLPDTPPQHNSTKRGREEEEEEDVFECSKKARLEHSLCHICMFRLKKNNKKSRCYCRKLVHHSCFLGDGSICK